MKITTAAPGSAQGLYLIVSDIEAARKDLVARSVEVTEVFHASKPGAQFGPESDGRVSGPDPGHRSYFSFATLSDRMATPGCSRRSQRACPDVDSAIWTSRC